MLKALELVGFKSFADRTRFDFPPGITVVVGPNGSGKSNIVDGLKWVLGEQSAKSLRGKDMADVIFKGSGGPQGRKPANSAEATIILENDDRRFPYDHDEIRVTRRVYRSGESEYLINNEAVRLRDIRDLFRGTGVGTDAYSLIEQGKVERMLQSTSKDRRAIFEEAAGISRFKAKSIETQRRLARVEQNLIRLADIVEEVGSRYRSIKAQASKAVRYRQATTRLKLLRTHVAKIDYQFIKQRLEQLTVEGGELQTQLANMQQAVDAAETSWRAGAEQGQAAQATVEAKQKLSADVREQLAVAGSEFQEKQWRASELEQRLQRMHAQWEGGKQRRQQLVHEQDLLNAEMEKTEAQHFDVRRALETLQPRLVELQSSRQQAETESRALTDQLAQLRRDLNAATTRMATAQAETEGLQEAITKREATLLDCTQKLQQLTAQKEDNEASLTALHQQAELKDSDLKQLSENIHTIQTQIEESRSAEAELRTEQHGDQQRSAVIREMETQLEGVNSGVKQVLTAAKEGLIPFHQVIGLVADLIQVEMQHALLIDLALGDFAQHIVLHGDELIQGVARADVKLAGRVGLLTKEHPASLGGDLSARLPADPRVIGPATEFVQAKAGFEAFVHQLLGGTWIVATLAGALELRQESHINVRLVTMAGEIVEPDGRIIVGAKSSTSNLVSRRSELRLLENQLNHRQNQLDKLSTELTDLRHKLENQRQHHQKLLAEQRELNDQIQDRRRHLDNCTNQIAQWTQLARQWQEEQAADESRLEQLREVLAAERQQHEQQLAEIANTEESLERCARSSADSNLELQEVEKQLTSTKVQFAKLEQQLHQFISQQEAIVSALRERDQQLVEWEHELQTLQSELTSVKTRCQELESIRAEREAELAVLTQQVTEAVAERDQFEQDRARLAQELESQRSALKRFEHRRYEIEGESNQLQMQETQLIERLRDDYGLEIDEVLKYQPRYATEDSSESEEIPTPGESESPTSDDTATTSDATTEDPTPGPRLATTDDADTYVSLDREVVDQEIQQLRRKINSIGAVNMDALAELEALEQRYQLLHTQYQDLNAAKEGLHKIIQRINADSRRIFAETLEAIRINFQQLYRKTFGGGHADLILDESEDILESGIEIVATPPGKSEFSNSLLSGGEKALTAVSLLLAIFKYRPSPFCVLDEVDAPFDEANIGRFVDVLKDFLGWTRFVIVTHSKKTMTAATTLYGVTMQDSGISKRVSIKFEEVSEDGQLLNPGDPAAQVTQ